MNNRAIERNLGIYYGFYSKKLRDIIPIRGYFEFERDMGKRRVDIFVEEEDHDIYIEMQICDSDASHLKQILKIIKSDQLIDDTKIIWIATGFHSGHIDEVKRALKSQSRRLEFLALTISPEMIQQLEAYANTDEFKIIDKLSKMSNYDDTELYCKFNNYHSVKKRKYSYKRLADPDNDLVKFYIKEIRRQISSWPNAYRSKGLTARMISFGGGVNDIYFRIGINRYDMLSVEVQFANKQAHLFNDLYVCSHIIENGLKPIPRWDTKNHKIYHSIPFNKENKNVLLKKQVGVLKRYLEVLYPLVQNREKIVSARSDELESIVELLMG